MDANKYRLSFSMAASLLGACAWLMPSAPFLIFIAMAPLFALADQKMPGARVWERLELILLPLAISSVAASWWQPQYLAIAILQSILLTLTFLAFHFCRSVAGPRLGLGLIIVFWLALEYTLLHIPYAENYVLLGDALHLWPSLTRWSSLTGYLGVSAWILICNLLVYLLVKHTRQSRIVVTLLLLLLLITPVAYGLWADLTGITREVIGKAPEPGEWVGRTCAWLAVLVVAVISVRSFIKK